MCECVCITGKPSCAHHKFAADLSQGQGPSQQINERIVTEIRNYRGAQQPLVYLAAVAAITVALQPGQARLVPQRVTCHMYA